MTRLLTAFFLLFLSVHSNAQNLPDFSNIKLDTKDDFTAAADEAALQACQYLLSTPPSAKDAHRLRSTQYLIRWMTGTPSYMFHIDDLATKVAKKDNDLLAVYLASMGKFCLENKDQSSNERAVKLNSVKAFIAYCKNPANGVRMNNELKKLVSADEKGQLEEYLFK